jgi:hypothetical protein
MARLFAASLLAVVLMAASARSQEIAITSESFWPTPVVSTWYSPPITPLAGPVSTPPYSYYAAYPFPARGYVGYGVADSFPFYGNPYGRPYDAWTWQYLGGANQYRMHFFYPPLR